MAANSGSNKSGSGGGLSSLIFLIFLGLLAYGLITSCSGKSEEEKTASYPLQLKPAASAAPGSTGGSSGYGTTSGGTTSGGSSGTASGGSSGTASGGSGIDSGSAAPSSNTGTERQLIGLWSRDPNAQLTEYIEFYYGSDGTLRYYNYFLTNVTFADPAEYQVSFGDVHLQVNQSSCFCIADFSKDGKITRAFYIDQLSDGILIDQVNGTPFYKISDEPQTQQHEPDD